MNDASIYWPQRVTAVQDDMEVGPTAQRLIFYAVGENRLAVDVV